MFFLHGLRCFLYDGLVCAGRGGSDNKAMCCSAVRFIAVLFALVASVCRRRRDERERERDTKEADTKEVSREKELNWWLLGW